MERRTLRWIRVRYLLVLATKMCSILRNWSTSDPLFFASTIAAPAHGKTVDSTVESGETVWLMDREQKPIPTERFVMKGSGLTTNRFVRNNDSMVERQRFLCLYMQLYRFNNILVALGRSWLNKVGAFQFQWRRSLEIQVLKQIWWSDSNPWIQLTRMEASVNRKGMGRWMLAVVSSASLCHDVWRAFCGKTQVFARVPFSV